MARKTVTIHKIICDRCETHQETATDSQFPTGWGLIDNALHSDILIAPGFITTERSVVCPHCYRSFLTWLKGDKQ